MCVFPYKACKNNCILRGRVPKEGGGRDRPSLKFFFAQRLLVSKADVKRYDKRIFTIILDIVFSSSIHNLLLCYLWWLDVNLYKEKLEDRYQRKIHENDEKSNNKVAAVIFATPPHTDFLFVLCLPLKNLRIWFVNKEIRYILNIFEINL